MSRIGSAVVFQATHGGINFPVAQEAPVTTPGDNHFHNIPAAEVPRSELASSIPVIDLSNKNAVVGEVTVYTPMLPPTYVEGQGPDLFAGASVPATVNNSFPQPLATPVMPVPGLSSGNIASTKPSVRVQFDINVGGQDETFHWSYADVIWQKEGSLLVFVSPVDGDKWFPAVREEPVAVRIGEEKLVHLALVLPLRFSYAGNEFRMMVSLEQRQLS